MQSDYYFHSNKDAADFFSHVIKKGNIYTIYDDLVGFITSSNKSYNIDEFIAIGYIKKSAMNHQLVNNLKVTNLPFIKTNYYRKL